MRMHRYWPDRIAEGIAATLGRKMEPLTFLVPDHSRDSTFQYDQRPKHFCMERVRGFDRYYVNGVRVSREDYLNQGGMVAG